MQSLMAHLLPPKSFHHQKSHLLWGLFKIHNYKLFEFIFHVNKIVKYLKHLPPFKITEIFKFALPLNWKIFYSYRDSTRLTIIFMEF